jgi:hypothetical protein
MTAHTPLSTADDQTRPPAAASPSPTDPATVHAWNVVAVPAHRPRLVCR